MGERRQAQGESVMRYQVDLPQLQENTRTVLGAGLGECSSAFSTASDRCAVSAAPVTCTPLRVCSSFSEYGSPQRAVPKGQSPNTVITPHSGRGSRAQGKPSLLLCSFPYAFWLLSSPGISSNPVEICCSLLMAMVD